MVSKSDADIMNFTLSCSCGKLKGLAENISGPVGNRIVCMCDDCQAYAHYLNRAKDVLDTNGGTDIFQVAPFRIKITSGNENLKCVRLSDKGMIRWFAGCCNTPVGNTMASSKVPFIGMVHLFMNKSGDKNQYEKAVGPIIAKVQGQFAIGELPEDAYKKAPLSLILRAITFLFFAWLKKQHQPNPVFDSSGKPTVEPHVLSKEERDNLRPLCGPK